MVSIVYPGYVRCVNRVVGTLASLTKPLESQMITTSTSIKLSAGKDENEVVFC